MSEQIIATFIRKGPEERNKRPITNNAPRTDYSVLAVSWDKNGHTVGLMVEYSVNRSHKEAFSVLVAGMWEALQDPDSFDLTPTQEDKDALGNPEPYMVLD